MDKIFIKKIEGLYNKKKFNQIKFELATLNEEDNKTPFVLNLRGIIELFKNNYDQAKVYFYQALEIDKYYIHCLLNLIKISYIDKDYDKIISLLKDYHLKNPNNKEVLVNLADLTFTAGHVEDTINFHKKLIDSGKFNLKDLSALIVLLNYMSSYSEKEYKKYCELYNSYLEKKKLTYNLKNHEHNKLKIAFLSYDLRNTSVGFFLKDFIKELKKKNFFPIALNLSDPGKNKNFFVSELKQSFSEWYDVFNLNDNDLSNFIYKKKVYFLFDLSGHTAENRLQIFKNKPAPVQISWLGYCNSTQIKEIDYLLVDPFVISRENEEFFMEKIIRLPNIWNSHSKIDQLEINNLPAIGNENFTFGSFNNFLKISNETIDAWVQILKNVPKSRLILKSSESSISNYKNYLFKRIDRNIDKKRIIFLNYEQSKNQHLKQYNKIDISLDTFPYNGNTTTFESIWMGVPVLTIHGKNFISRCGYSINKNLGMDDFIVKNKDEYIAKAVKLASKSEYEKLNKIRKSLRQKALTSPLFDNTTFAKNFAEKLIQISNYS